MKVSLNIVKQLIDFELPAIDELVSRINQQLGGVEEVIDLGAKYKDALIVKIVSAEKHPNADRLRVCMIDDDGARENVPRDDNGYVQVVCGAPNAEAGKWVVWLPPASTVPSSYDDKEPFVLDARELRGVLSQGMLAASDELAIGSDHEGILEIDRDASRPSDAQIKPGANFAKVFGLDDTIIDIENKMFTHRPDLFGQIGVAREISAILQGLPEPNSGDPRFVNPEWYSHTPQFPVATGNELIVFNEAEDTVPRFMAVSMNTISVRPSPLWLQCQLVALGAKPINNVVDITNYIMLMTAQPVHAYDYDMLHGATLGTRMAREGETVELINHKTYQLDTSDIVIVDGASVIGLAGIMGGLSSEVTSHTKNIVLEVATFDMYAVRKSSMRHGLFTDALTRFNKGQSPLQNASVLARLMSLMSEYSGAGQASRVFDLPAKTSGEIKDSVYGEIRVSATFINARLGLQLTPQQIGDLLRRVNIASYPADDDEDTLLLTAPFWRTDIELPEDIVEEVGRLYGFDKLPRELPSRTIKPSAENPTFATKQSIRTALTAAGANEVLTYSFVHKNIFKKAEQDSSQAFKLSNALSPDLQYYRLSVLPSLLDKVHMNVRAGYDEFVLFEIGKGHNKKAHAADDEGLPSELEFVDLVYTSKKPQPGAAFFHIKTQVTELARTLHVGDLVYKPIESELDFPVTAPFDLARSALVETTDGTFIGMIGELKDTVVSNFKLPLYTAAATLDLGGIVTAKKDQNYRPLSKYPSTSQDISLRVDQSLSYQALFDEVQNTVASLELDDISYTVTPLNIYQATDQSQKTITFHMTFTATNRTLADGDVSPLLDAVSVAAHDTFGAERV